MPTSSDFVSTTFKRLAVGARFASASGDTKGQLFRKTSQRGAFRLKTGEFAGRGETHAEVPFSRSASVTGGPVAV